LPVTDETGRLPARDTAVRCFEAGDYGSAARLLAPLLASNPDDSLLHRLHGMALVRTGAPAKGLPSLAKAAALAPSDAVCATWQGIGLHAAGHHGDAAHILVVAAGLAPDDPAPLIHLSRALLRTGQPLEALDAAQRSAALAPRLLEAEQALRLSALAVLRASAESTPSDLAEAWLQVGRICMRLDKVMEAHAAFMEALGLQPLHPLAHCELALVEHLRGQPVAAATRLRAVLDRDPDCHAARVALASRLLLDDEAGSALALLDSFVAPPPGPLRSCWHSERAQALITLRRDGAAERELGQAEQHPVRDLALQLTWQRLVLASRQRRPEATILADRVERLTASREAGTLERRIDAHFDLADLHHAASRRVAAFAHWRRGHSLLALAQPFSRDAHDRYLAAITRSFDADQFANGPRAAEADPTPVFIVGLPRTGTTLLEQILSAHNAVHGGGERLAIRETLTHLTGTVSAGAAMASAASLDATSLTVASRAYVDDLRRLSPDATRVLDKMPDNIFHLGFISTLLPGARIICCTRDMRDVGLSIFKHRFIGHHPYAHDLADLGWYMAAHQRLLAHWRSCLPSAMLVLDHSDWIMNFDATLRRVLEFLDLDYDPACERFFEQDRRIGSASRAQVRRPINAEGVGRWRDYADQLRPMLVELPPGVR
jgi:tetratricopeptide (TPR) repeat protein